MELEEILLKLEDYYKGIYNGVVPTEESVDRQKAKLALTAWRDGELVEELQRLKGHEGGCNAGCDRIPHQEINERIKELENDHE